MHLPTSSISTNAPPGKTSEVAPTKPFSRIPAVGISINILFSYFAVSPAIPWLKLTALNNKQMQSNITFSYPVNM